MDLLPSESSYDLCMVILLYYQRCMYERVSVQTTESLYCCVTMNVQIVVTQTHTHIIYICTNSSFDTSIPHERIINQTTLIRIWIKSMYFFVVFFLSYRPQFANFFVFIYFNIDQTLIYILRLSHLIFTL